tara:strand:- start:24131 stop:25135 length:1005 start_codon:yes stop_codon:yes gene_type:complete
MIKENILAGANAIDALKKFNVDRSKFMNASEADTCIRRQWFSKQPDIEGEPQDWGFARRGNHMEDYFVKCMAAANMPLALAGDQQHSFADPDTKISATPDGVLEYEGENPIAIEFKSIDPRTNKNNLPRSGHVTQLKLAMCLMNKQRYFDQTITEGKKIEHGIIIYMDASNYNIIHEYRVDCDHSFLDKMAGRANKILRTRNVDVLDREGKTTKECTRCPFKADCGVAVEGGGGGGDKRGNRGSNLHDVVQQFLDIKIQEGQLKQSKDMLTEEIKQEVLSRNADRLVVGGVQVSLKAVKGRASLNRKAIAQAGIDLSMFETIGAPSERLEVKQL